MLLILENIFRFVILVLLQVLLLNNIQFLGYINPYLYVLFIIALPVQTPRWFTLILAFMLGLTIDTFSNTLGMHAFATVLIAFLRNGIIKLFATIDEGNSPTPSFHAFGVGAYIKYVIAMVFIHHSALFFLEAFTLVSFWVVLGKLLLSAIVTILLITSIQSLKKA